MTRIVLKVLAWFYIVAMVTSAACVISSRSMHNDAAQRAAYVTFAIAFFAGPWTALLHVWLSPRIEHKMALTRKLCLGFDAYFAAYRYLLKGEKFV